MKTLLLEIAQRIEQKTDELDASAEKLGRSHPRRAELAIENGGMRWAAYWVRQWATEDGDTTWLQQQIRAYRERLSYLRGMNEARNSIDAADVDIRRAMFKEIGIAAEDHVNQTVQFVAELSRRLGE